MDLSARQVTLDTGALVAVDRGDRERWGEINRLVADGAVPVVPTAVVAEAWRSAGQARLGQLLRLCRIEPLDERTAREAGELCGRAGTADPVDAVVVVSASRRGGYVLTSDVRDLIGLTAHLPRDRPVLAIRGLGA